MTWLLIGVIFLVAFGPLMWVMPTKRDRQLAALREHARKEGLVLDRRRLPKLDPAAEERVSAGGRIRKPEVESTSYSLMLGRRLQLLGGWRLLRHGGQPEIDAVPPGWVLDPGMRDAKDAVNAAAELLPGVLGDLPEDVIAVELTPAAVTFYWLEPTGAGDSEVDEMRDRLARFGERVTALDDKKLEQLAGEDS